MGTQPPPPPAILTLHSTVKENKGGLPHFIRILQVFTLLFRCKASLLVGVSQWHCVMVSYKSVFYYINIGGISKY